jgi:hypothetical protein
LQTAYAIYILALFIDLSHRSLFSKNKVDRNSVVKDSSGTVYPSIIWKALLMKCGLTVKPENATDANTHFFLVSLTEEEKASRFAKGG